MSKDSKVAIVTGGGKGIGAEIALHLLAQNMQVIIADIDPTAKNFDLKDSSRLLFIKTDIKNEAAIKAMIRKGLDHFGRIDCLINNAGILPDKNTSFEQITLKFWNEYIATNLTGAFLCAKYAAPHLRKHTGNIINIASTRALQSEGNNGPMLLLKAASSL